LVYIKKVEIRGFKSIGRAITLTLSNGLTAITGPNGSGKSNIIDAILFALGESKAKSLRVNRFNSLLHDLGPDKKEETARVSVLFDNSDRKIPIDSDNVTVTRELKFTGESIYYLQGRRTSRSIISDVLSVANISYQGLNIIPQGMVTRLSELMPDEKRRLIEEVVGVAQFDEKKAQALELLKEADLKLQVAVAKIDEIRKRVLQLEEERNDQIRLKQLEENLKWLKAVQVSKALSNLELRILSLEERRKELEKRKDEVKEEISEVEKELEAAERERKEFIENVIEGSASKQAEVQGKIARVENEIRNLEQELSEAEATVIRLEDSLPRLKEMMFEQEKRFQHLESAIKNRKKQIISLNKEKKELEMRLSKVLKERTRSEKRLNTLRERVGKKRKRIEGFRLKVSEINAQLEGLRSRKEIVEKRVKTLEEKANSFKGLLSKLEESLRRINEIIGNQDSSINELEEELRKIEERKAVVEKEVERAKAILERVGVKIGATEAKLSMLGANPFVASKRIEELSEEGIIDGFVGTLSSMITYPKTYEKAILACGQRWLSAVLVKDVKAMVKVAEICKRFKLGRLIIVPILDIGYVEKLEPSKERDVIGVLSDVIECDDEIRNVVNLAFGNIVLVSSHRAAYSLASRGYKCVTSNGDVFEPKALVLETGKVSNIEDFLGGLIDEESLESVKQALESLKRLIKERKRIIKELDKNIEKLKKQKFAKIVRKERLSGEVESLKMFISRHQKLRLSIEKEVKKLAQEVKRIEVKSSNLRKLKDKITKKIEEIERSIEREDIENLSIKIQELVKKRQELTSNIEAITEQLREAITEQTKEQAQLEHSLKVSLARLKEEIAQSEALLKDRKEFLEKGSKELERLKKELSELKEDEKRLAENVKRAKAILERYEARVIKIRKKLEGLRRTNNTIEKEVVNVEKNKEVVEDNMQRLFNELRSYGYSKPLDYFEGVDAMLIDIEKEYEDLRNRVNLLADTNYKAMFESYKNLSLRRNQLEQDRDSIVRFIEEVEAEKKKIFLTAFEKIDRELRAVFKAITGGSAWLEIENPDNIFGSGVFLMTQFPGKVAREASAVSGGEKTVATLSFILAIQSVFPSPFYLFDEIDAHLDPVNSERLADLLKERARKSQIIVVTLRDTLVSRADQVYGVYMTRGGSNIVRYRPGMEVITKSG
jgi:chromosome segregation protein